MKVDFLIVGAQKSGTTALDNYLRGHREIEMAKRKEVHFFDNENNFANEVDYSKYHASFANESSETVKGESTPIYMYWHDAPKRIWEYNSKMKLIAILRNPIDRAFSHWNMERDRNADDLPFSEAIRTESARCRKALPLQHRVYSYIDRCFYTEQIRRLWRFFPKDQTFILKHEDLKFDCSHTLSLVSEFIGVEQFNNVQYEDVHSKKYVSQMSKTDYSYLHGVFFHEIKQLEAMLDWNCDDWLKRD